MKYWRYRRVLIRKSYLRDRSMFLSSSNSIMSSTNASPSATAWLSVPCCTYIPRSVFNICNQINERKLSSVSNELRLAFIRLYGVINSLALTLRPEPTLVRLSGKKILLSKVTYNSSLTLFSRSAVVMSRYFMVIQAPPRTPKTRYIAAMLTNGTEVLSKLIPDFCRNSCVTNLALYHSTFFFLIELLLKNHARGYKGVLDVFARLNSKISLTSSEASSEDIVILHTSNSAEFMTSAINPGPASLIIAQSTTSVPSLSNCSFFSALTQLAYSFFFLEPSESCYAGPRLLSRFPSLVICAALATVAEVLFGAAAIGLCSCSHSVSLLFSSSGTNDSIVLHHSFSYYGVN